MPDPVSAANPSGPDQQAVEILRNQVIRLEAFERTSHATGMLQNRVPVWPLIKYLLVKQTIFAMGRGFTGTDAFEAHVRTLRKRDIAGKGWLKRYRMQRRARIRDIADVLPALADRTGRDSRSPVLLFGSASGFQDSPQGRISAHHHALRTALVARGHRVLAFYDGNPAAADLAASGGADGDVDLDPLLRHIGKTAPCTAFSEGYLRPVFPEFEGLARHTGHRGETICAYADILTGHVTLAIDAMTALLDRLQPRAVFFSNYASVQGWAMAHVCHQRGIPCIDIQHGIEGRHNGAYHFASAPPEDWSIVPTHHLTWTQQDADVFTAQHPARRAAVMGTHTGQLARLSDVPVPAELRALTAQGPVLLFTAQFASDILVARDLARVGLTVIFRSHPTRHDETHALVEASDLEMLHCRIGSELALTTLIQACNGLITGYSATILEAAEWGKPVFATGAFASLLAQDYAPILDHILTVDPDHGGDGLADRLRHWSHGLARSPTRSSPVLPDMNTALDALQAGL